MSSPTGSFSAAEALLHLQALGIVVNRDGFHFPEGCKEEQFDALLALGTTENAKAVMHLAGDGG